MSDSHTRGCVFNFRLLCNDTQQ